MKKEGQLSVFIVLGIVILIIVDLLRARLELLYRKQNEIIERTATKRRNSGSG